MVNHILCHDSPTFTPTYTYTPTPTPTHLHTYASDRLYCTVGCHPTRCTEFDQHPEGPQGYLNALRAVAVQGIKAGKCVALGELGLDYDRYACGGYIE